MRDFLRRPLAAGDWTRLFERLETEQEPNSVAPRGRVVAFVSNKGGVGKSTLATNTACALARRHPGEVLLVDAALQLGVCASLLDVQPEATLADAVRQRDRLDERLLRELCAEHACGLRLLAAPIDAVDAQDVDEDGIARLLTLARRCFRFVVIDTLPLLDNLLVGVVDGADRLYVVLQGTVPDVIGAARYLQIFDRLGVPEQRRRVVLNRTYPGHAGRLSTVDVEERLGLPVDYELPYRKGMLVAQSLGQPYVLGLRSRFGFRRAHDRLVADVEASAQPPSRPEARVP